MQVNESQGQWLSSPPRLDFFMRVFQSTLMKLFHDMKPRSFMLGLCGLFLGAMTAYNSDVAESYIFQNLPYPVELAVFIGAVAGFFTGFINE